MDEDIRPIIDWENAVKLSGNNQALAEDILALFLKQLPHDYQTIKLSYQQQKYAEMMNQIHKLHGALCYCGLPRLKSIITQLESDLKNHIMDRLPILMQTLDQEVHILLNYCSKNNA